MSESVTIDGSSGGGQMLRNAVALSAVTGRAVRVINIRSGRRNPGLRPQHLTGVKAVAEACAGEVRGAAVGSTEVELAPGPVRARQGWRVDIGTAGSISLLLQSLLPVLTRARGPSDVALIGGTDVPFSPPLDYVTEVFAPALREMGQRVELTRVMRGYYPRGGGELWVRTPPTPGVRALRWIERGQVTRIRGRSYSMNLLPRIAPRMRDYAAEVLTSAGYDVDIELEITPSGRSTGCGIALWAETESGRVLGGGALGERGKPAERVGIEAAESLLRELTAPGAVDSHLADQLIVWLALADAPSEFTTGRVTDHLRNAILVAEAIAGARFTVEEGEPVRVKCQPGG